MKASKVSDCGMKFLLLLVSDDLEIYVNFFCGCGPVESSKMENRRANLQKGPSHIAVPANIPKLGR